MLPSEQFRLVPDTEYRCFYCGLELIRTHSPTVQNDAPRAIRYSREHLLPKTLMKKRKLRAHRHTVPASTLINGLVGTAPIKVKFALKEHFKTIDDLDTLSNIALRQTLEQIVKEFLDQYLVHDLYPWNWYGGRQKKHTTAQRKEIYQALLDLLTDEEKEFRLYKIM